MTKRHPSRLTQPMILLPDDTQGLPPTNCWQTIGLLVVGVHEVVYVASVSEAIERVAHHRASRSTTSASDYRTLRKGAHWPENGLNRHHPSTNNRRAR